MKIKVAFLPTSPLAIAGDVCIVVDVIRATTALVGLFDAGSNRVFVGGFRSDVAKARAAVGENGVICAELDDGSTPLGFDHEPSPSLLSRLDLSGRSAMLATANGTPAILAAVREGAALILIGSLRNLDAVARRALSEASSRKTDITIICSGQLRNSRIAIEDSYCAGMIVSRFCDLSNGDAVKLDDSASLAHGFTISQDSAVKVLLGSMTGRRFIGNCRQNDVEFCARINESKIVPVMTAQGEECDHPVYLLDA
ncbi:MULTISPECIES: 2-phosphosulfolactate phosphatase [unclassified Mesorhizobium]|uniref:2-phosphosulfolactate phosphatase n=1 Tax=unclassified Mesorhizobium TaxID=325217 RepID=UPI0019295AE1|nr:MULTISPECIES: 2-phosphosulfolactate phosphatase [unclassified Mesorhizobium]BCG97469.1 putative 2-phosphosulfolactate phosphatase [Mesorhizobium sp. 131-2-1]BCH04537.1 putative 2-phosphosulfolactate phosphatase [Mesorhizobium sp. 131-2-5]